jgi:hypothetical protein
VFDPLARMFGELNPGQISFGAAARIASELETVDCRGDNASWNVKCNGQVIHGRRPAKEQHRHARQVLAIQGKDSCRNVIEGGRFLLEVDDFDAHQGDQSVARRGNEAPPHARDSPPLFHACIISTCRWRAKRARASQQDPAKHRKRKEDRQARC